MPINWKNRREKEIKEVKMVYKEIQRREDLIKEYYLRKAVEKGEASVTELKKFQQQR